MSTLTLFKAKKEQEKAEAKAQRAEAREQQKADRAAEKVVFNTFKALIKPFNGQTISGLKIKVVCKDAKREIELIINGKLHRIFFAWTEPHYCNCSECADGGYGHPPDYTQEVGCCRPDKKGKRGEKDYFFWYGNTREEQEKRFVESFDELVKEYKSNLEWYGHPDGRNAAEEDEE